MKFEITVSDGRMGQWQETYDVDAVVDQKTADARGRKMIDNFNRSRGPHERHRIFVKATVLEDKPPPRQQEFQLSGSRRRKRIR